MGGRQTCGLSIPEQGSSRAQCGDDDGESLDEVGGANTLLVVLNDTNSYTVLADSKHFMGISPEIIICLYRVTEVLPWESGVIIVDFPWLYRRKTNTCKRLFYGRGGERGCS